MKSNKFNPLTITLTRYAEPDWLIMQTLESLSKQTEVNGIVLFYDQNNNSDLEKKIKTLNTENIKFEHKVIPAKSLSYARNKAIEESSNDLILYIDSDAIAEPDWAKFMLQALEQDNTAVVGGRIILKWHKKPLFITRSRVVREQYSDLDFGTELKESKKIVGASFGINRKLLGKDAFFDEKLGRRPGVLLGGEESDLCKRALSKSLKVFYQGKALVYHQVLPDRITYSWILRRLYYAGVGRATSGGSPSSTHKMGMWDYLILPVILPFYIAGYIRKK